MPPLYKAKSEFLEGLLVAHDDRPRPRLRSEEHTSELQSQSNLVCRLLLEKKKRSSGWNRPSPSALMKASLGVQHWKKPSARSPGSSARYEAYSRGENHRAATSSASGSVRTASTSTPTSRLEERAYTATSLQCDTLNRRSEVANRPASAGLPRDPEASSTASGRSPSRAASSCRSNARATMNRLRSGSNAKRRARSRSRSDSSVAEAETASGPTSGRATTISTSPSVNDAARFRASRAIVTICYQPRSSINPPPHDPQAVSHHSQSATHFPGQSREAASGLLVRWSYLIVEIGRASCRERV